MSCIFKNLLIATVLALIHSLSAFTTSYAHDSLQTSTNINDGRVQLTFGLFLPSINSSAQISRKSGAIGTTINLESAFNLPRSETLFRFNGIYRFNNFHSVEGYFYDLNRSGQNTPQDSIVFGKLVIPLKAYFTSHFRATLFGGKYRYSIQNSKSTEFSFSVGISFLYVDFGADVESSNQLEKEEKYNDLLFLPVFGFSNRVNISEDLIFRGNLDAFALDMKRYNGILVDFSFLLEYQFLKMFSLGLSYNAFVLDVKIDSKEKVEINYNLKGFMFFAKAYF